MLFVIVETCFKEAVVFVTHVCYFVSWVSFLLGANIRLNRHLEPVSIVCRVTNVYKKMHVAVCIYRVGQKDLRLFEGAL